jgi:oligosaccharide repeat unit polymerase
MSIFLTIFFLGLAISDWKGWRKSIANPALLFAFVWILLFISYATGYRLKLPAICAVSSSSWDYLMICLIAFLVGSKLVSYGLAHGKNLYLKQKTIVDQNAVSKVILILSAIGIMGILLSIATSPFAKLGLSLTDFSDLFYARRAQVAHLYSEDSSLGSYIASVFVPCGYIGIVLGIYYWSKIKLYAKFGLLGFFTAALLLTITTGSRIHIFLILMFGVYVFLLSLPSGSIIVSPRKLLRMGIIGALGLGMVIVGFSIQSLLRNVKPGYRIDTAYLSGSLVDSIDRTFGDSNRDLVIAIAYNYLYYGPQITNLDLTLQYGLKDIGMGSYQFSKTMSRLPLSDTPNWLAIREELFSIFHQAGRFENVWATAIREMVADFGKMGAVIAFFLCGALAQFAYMRFLQTRSAPWLFAATVAGVWVIWSPNYSLFLLSWFENCVYFLIFWFALSKWSTGTRRRHDLGVLAKTTYSR